MRISVLTSSRADFGIQVPLLGALRDDPYFDLELIAFGSHLYDRFGGTITEIHEAGYFPELELPPVLIDDDPAGIALAMARTMEQFSQVWSTHETDLAIVLGDRYEMFAAAAAAVPFGIEIAHLHGGETTLGAIDNVFRNSISHMSSIHFTAAEPYRERVVELMGEDRNIYNTGALSVDNIRALRLLSIDEILDRIGIDLSEPTALVTFHPETVNIARIEEQMAVLWNALCDIGTRYRVLVTMPNADTDAHRIRAIWQSLLSDAPFATAVESLGSLVYLSCMKHCAFMLGNTSSGYIEAAYFAKQVIDLGDRQTGRIVTPNICRSPIELRSILECVDRVATGEPCVPTQIYGDGHAASRIVRLLKDYHCG